MAKRATPPAAFTNRRAVPKPDPILLGLQQLPEEALRRFMEGEIGQNPMFGFRFGVVALLYQQETSHSAYLDLIRRTFQRLETEEEVFGSLMTDPDFGGFEGLPNFGGPMFTMREQTMAELGGTLLAGADAAYRTGNLPLVTALLLAGLIGDMELAETRMLLVQQLQELPLKGMVGMLMRIAQDAPPDLAATSFDALMTVLGQQKGFPKFSAAESLLLRVMGEFVRTDAEHQRLVALFGALDARVVASPNAAQRAGGPTPVQARMTVVLLHAQYLAETADRPAEARQVFEANLSLGPEVRARYLQLISPPEALDTLLRWTAPGAPDWALTQRSLLLADLVRFADQQGRSDVLREAALRQLRELLTRPYQQPRDYASAWQRLRATHPAAEWTTARLNLMADLQQQVPNLSQVPTNDPRRNFTATFDRLDSDTDRQLVELRKRPRFDLLHQYGIFWLPERAAELVGLYARALPDFLEEPNNKNAAAYQRVAQALWRLLQHVEAEEPVVALVEELVATYPRRRLLLEELRTVGFSFDKPKAVPRTLGHGNGDDDQPAAPRKPGRRGR
ncbi:MAG: hypothetical protein H7330_07325 [Hymenobacteraceae bacterium]|nr:hypothetical protein [Hymenobacteraceae bacterium]